MLAAVISRGCSCPTSGAVALSANIVERLQPRISHSLHDVELGTLAPFSPPQSMTLLTLQPRFSVNGRAEYRNKPGPSATGALLLAPNLAIYSRESMRGWLDSCILHWVLLPTCIARSHRHPLQLALISADNSNCYVPGLFNVRQ
jgi:uncharacterized metal-binding protein